MTMKVQLLVSEWCVPCRDAERVWQEVSRAKEIALEVLDVGQPEGRSIVANLGVRTVPSTVIDGRLAHLGVPTLGEANALIAAAPDRAADADSHYVGLTLEATSAWFIASSAAYLALAGVALLAGGGIAGDAPWRPSAIHAFGLGFGAFMIFGLGEHMLPRFTSRPIRGGWIAWMQLALAHAGVLALVAGFATHLRALAIAGGTLAWIAFAVFTVRLFPVLALFRKEDTA